MISGRQLSQYFDRGAKRHNGEVLHYRIEVAEPEFPTEAELREMDRAIARFWARRKRLKIAQKKTVDTPHTFPYNSPQL
jgi:hypothetical protein